MFSYDSRHKIIVGILIMIWAAWHFLARDPAQERYTNGQLKRSGGQVDNLNHGLWTWYHENGRKQMEGRFEQGKRVGAWLTFEANGDTLTKAQYEADRLNGSYIEYGPGNMRLRKLTYRNDRLVAGGSEQP
jgi:antitoxin component YwqK of YwqJK toxin-antitoxin module